MQKHDTETSETTENTATTATTATTTEVKVPFFARKQGRPALTVRTGVHGGRESKEKAI